jgi:hypothetical protein
MSSGARLAVIEDDAAILYPDDEEARSSYITSRIILGPALREPTGPAAFRLERLPRRRRESGRP